MSGSSKKSNLDEVRMFKLLYGGTWEEGPTHLWPVRKFVPQQIRNGKMIPAQWVDNGLNEFLTYKYVGAKSVESRMPWDGDTASIIDIMSWIIEGVPECDGNSFALYWLWGKQRYQIVKDLDLIYFWDHAPTNVDGYTEIIVDISPVVQLGVDPSYQNKNEGTTTDCEEIEDLTVVTPKKTQGMKTKSTPKKRTPIKLKKATHVEKKSTPVKKKATPFKKKTTPIKKKCGKGKEKLPVKRKVDVESGGPIDIDSELSGDGEWNHDADEHWDWDNIAREEDVEDVKGQASQEAFDSVDHIDEELRNVQDVEDVEGQASQEAFDSVDDEPRHDEPRHDEANDGYTAEEPRHDEANAGHTAEEPRHDEANAGHTAEEPSHDEANAGYTAEEPRHDEANAGHTAEEPRHDEANAGYTAEEPRHDEANAGHTAEEPRQGEEGNASNASKEPRDETSNANVHHEEHVTVDFLGKTFNLDQLDASDEEYLSAESSDEDIEPNENDDEPLKRKTPQKPSVDGEGPSDRGEGEGPRVMVNGAGPSDRGDGEGPRVMVDGEGPSDGDGDFIKKTDMLEEDDDLTHGGDGLQLFVDKTWENIYVCRQQLRDYAVEKKFEYKYKKNDSDKIILLCKQHPVCQWRVLIARTNDKHTMECRKIEGRHTCIGNVTDKNSMATAPWIAAKVEQEMRMHYKTFKPENLKEIMRTKWHVTVTYWQAWHAKVLALERLFGNYEESYGKIPELCRQIQLSNPGSITAYSRDHATGTFTHLIISFKASIDGFINGCRPLLGIDRCFLKGKYGGACLTMISLDGNNGMFPIAYCIGLSEDTLNWKRFLQDMHPYVSRHPEPLTFMSDRQKGLIEAVAEVFPNSYQRFCFRHMVKNLRTRYRGVDHIVWAAARAYRVCDFQRHMEELKQVDKNARAYMDNEPAGLWARAYFDVKACSDHNTNNFTECFNSYILEARDKPIVSLAVKIQTLLMKLIYHRNNLCDNWNSESGLVPRVENELGKLEVKSFDYEVGGASSFSFQIDHKPSGQWFTVDLQARVCSCNKWQLTGIPCVHVVAVLFPRRIPYIEYTHPYFTIEYYRKAYQGYIKPINHEDEWNKITVNVLPPITKRQPGRTRKHRRIDAYEAEASGKRRNEKRCKRCGEFGHNSTGCQNELEQDKYQTMPVVPNKGGRPKVRPERVVWDPETQTTKVLPNKGAGTGVTAKERAEILKGAKMAKAAKQAATKAAKQAAASVNVGGGRGRGRAGSGGNVGGGNVGGGRGRGRAGSGGNVGGGRGRGRAGSGGNVGGVMGRGGTAGGGNVGGGRGRGGAAGGGNVGGGRGRGGAAGGGNIGGGNIGGGRERGGAAGGGNVGGGRGRGGAAGGGNIGGGRERGRASQPTQPSTPPPMEDVTPQSQLTQPTQTDQRNPPLRSSSRLASMMAD